MLEIELLVFWHIVGFGIFRQVLNEFAYFWEILVKIFEERFIEHLDLIVHNLNLNYLI